MQTVLKARLHPHWVGGEADYVYSVICNGELLVERSRAPECDAARALVARGITGKLSLCDGKTGKPRTMIDVEKAAKLTVEELRVHPVSESTESGGSEGYSREEAVTGRKQHEA